MTSALLDAKGGTSPAALSALSIVSSANLLFSIDAFERTWDIVHVRGRSGLDFESQDVQNLYIPSH